MLPTTCYGNQKQPLMYDEIFLMIAYDYDFLSELATDSSVRHVPGMEIQCRGLATRFLVDDMRGNCLGWNF